MKTIKLILVTLLIPLAQMANGQQTNDSVLTLRACIQLGISNNFKLNQARLETPRDGP